MIFLKVLAVVLGLAFLLFGYFIYFKKKYNLINGFEADFKAGRKKEEYAKKVGIFSSKVKCGDCGSWYGPKVWHSNDAYRKVIWQCNHKFDGQKCATPTLTEDEIKELFLRATNQVIDQKEQLPHLQFIRKNA